VAPAGSSKLINERVNCAQIADVDLGSTPEGFQITITTDRLQVKFFVAEEMEGSKRCGSLGDLFYRYGARGGCLDRIQGSKSKRLSDARHEVL
jgi:hypothetical protein